MSSIIDWVIEAFIWCGILWYLDKYKNWRVNSWKRAFLLAVISIAFNSIIALVVLPIPFPAKAISILIVLPIVLPFKAVFIRIIAEIIGYIFRTLIHTVKSLLSYFVDI